VSFDDEARFFCTLLPKARPTRPGMFDALYCYGLLRAAFGAMREVSVPYYTTKYPRLASFWNRSFRLGIGRWLAPSVYYVASDASSGRPS
jgi:hypothetical protein